MAEPAPLEHFREDIPAPLAEVVRLALQRDPGERFADANEFAQALRWSRERSPAMPPAEQGAWVMTPQNRAAPPPAEQAQAAEQAAAQAAEQPEAGSDAPSEEEPPEQSTVLRVASHMPGIDPEAESSHSPTPSHPASASNPRLDSASDGVSDGAVDDAAGQGS